MNALHDSDSCINILILQLQVYKIWNIMRAWNTDWEKYYCISDPLFFCIGPESKFAVY